MRPTAKQVTEAHIDKIKSFLTDFIQRLTYRADVHDASKFSEEEMVPLQKMQELTDREGQVPYDSAKYKERLKILKPMLDHHYANNSHHPEHYENGVDGMDLLDVVEMFMDWKAASERGEESAMNITAATKRYKVSPQLESIFRNTAKTFNFKAT